MLYIKVSETKILKSFEVVYRCYRILKVNVNLVGIKSVAFLVVYRTLVKKE